MFGWFDLFNSPTMNRVQRLRRLKALADRTTGSQMSWDSCLWSEARKDRKLRAAGMPPNGENLFHSADQNIVFRFFGLSRFDAERLFGAADIAYKRQVLKAIIKKAKEHPGT